jgi:hypothetical protein
MGENFAAYNADGNFDERLWNANKAWIEETNRAPIINTIAQAETIVQQEDDGWGYMVDKEVEKYSSEMFEDFYKLRMARNSIVHASIGNVEIEMNVLKRCINWIEAL